MAQIKEFPSLKESVLDRIRKDIITCRLKPGEPIRDTDLAARYGVSTSPIREALVQLASERLVDMPPNKSKIVSPLNVSLAMEVFAIYRVVALSTFSWAAPNIHSRDLDKMKRALAHMEKMKLDKDGYKFLTHSNEFFLTAYGAAGNAEALDIIRRSLHRIERIILFYEISLSTDLPQAMFNHLASGDFSGAVRAHFDIFDRFGQELGKIESRREAAMKPKQVKAARRLGGVKS
ncbi:MAG: GntR family transcriptional regulator [Caulobacterales bacterium]